MASKYVKKIKGSTDKKKNGAKMVRVNVVKYQNVLYWVILLDGNRPVQSRIVC